MTELSNILVTIKNRFSLLIGRGIVRSVSPSGKVQRIQITSLKDDTLSDVEQLQPYGLESYPKPSSSTEALFLCVNGNRGQAIITNILDRRYRPKDLAEGEVCLYDFNGSRVHLKQNGDMIIKDLHGNKIETFSDKMKITDVNGNIIESDTTKWKINSNLTVEQ